MSKPAFLITVDTEGDNLWARPKTVTTRNASYLRRFQELCETYGLKPTYLTNWEMAHCPEFMEHGKDVLTRNTGEIGMHLHAWDSPPLVPLTADDARYHPYLIEYGEDQMREKVHVMTAVLEDTFGLKMVSHRAGRWGFDERYARILAEHQYRVDCSVTPHMSWASSRGAPSGKGGPDFSTFPDTSYFLDLEDIRRSGESHLLEVPVTVMMLRFPRISASLGALLRTSAFATRVGNRLFQRAWLYPDGRNGEILLRILRTALQEGRAYVELAFHSSELMPGGSPAFPHSVESLYDSLEALFSAARGQFEGRTLHEYYDLIKQPLASA